MARVTVEDCIVKVPNRFELVVLAAQRARQISAGAPLTIERDNEKNPVLALREIANSNISPESLESSIIKGYQQYVELDETEQEMANMLSEEQELIEREIEIGGGSLDGFSIEEAGQPAPEASVAVEELEST